MCCTLLRLLTFCEPLDLDTLTSLVGSDAVEDAETRGLIRVVAEHQSGDVRFNHPLFGELIRRRLGMAAARRLRGELVRALRDRPLRAPGQRIRLAELTLDSDEAPDVELLVTAARDAIALTNITLGERLARAAVSRGGGLDASELLARSLLWQGKAAESEETLSLFDPDTMTELELVRWGTARIANLQWSMGDAEGADEVLKLLRSKVTHPGLRLLVDGVASASLLFENRARRGSRTRRTGAGRSRRIRGRRRMGGLWWRTGTGADGAGGRGRGGRRTRPPRRARGRRAAAVSHCVRRGAGVGPGRRIRLRRETIRRHRADLVRPASTWPGAWPMCCSGTIELARGSFLDTVPRMEQTVAALTSESAASWSFPARLLLAQSYCALGRVEPGAKMVAELRTRFGRHVALFGPQLRIAESWLAAAEGNVSGAIVLALDAARLAKESGQRAIEMLALHDAVRYGDRSSLARLVEVAHATGGRLATALAAHAAAVTDRNADAIYAAAQQLEQIGALLLAADAAAQAAAAYQAAGDRRHAGEAAGTAHRLAAACGGLRTPALELAGSPLPLTVREREMANLVAAGLSNRDIADRLTVSVRTVEGHLYRACTKCDCTDRDQLAAVIRSGQPR